MGVVENDDGCNAGCIVVVVVVARRWERVDSVDEEKAAALGTTNMVGIIAKDVMQTDAISAVMTPMLAMVNFFVAVLDARYYANRQLSVSGSKPHGYLVIVAAIRICVFVDASG